MAAASAIVSASSLTAVLEMQSTQGILISNERSSSASGATSARLNVALVNQTTSSTVFAYITGLAINNDNAVWLLQSDGATDYYPTSPSSTGTALAVSCAISLGSPGSTTEVSIPEIAGGRVWFSVESTLTFLLNPGPGLVEPSVTNPSDPNIDVSWDFCEFTWNSAQLFANISYVDFVCLPIALDTLSTTGATQHVSGMPTSGLDSVCSALIAQSATDGSDWSSLIVTAPDGSNLRALSPNNGIITQTAQFTDYYTSYVNDVWSLYGTSTLEIDTQASYGTVSGQITSNLLTFPGGITFAQPSTADIFSCSTGPFATGSNDEVNALIPRLAAAFNRSTMLTDSDQPDLELVTEYYANPITNHYSRICHSVNLDGLGYGFPYDDVASTDATNQSGAVADGSPMLWTITVGGANAFAKAKAKPRRRRDMPSMAQMTATIQSPLSQVMKPNEKAQLRASEMIDLERGDKVPGNWEEERISTLNSAMLPVLKRAYERIAPQLQPLLDNAYLRQVIAFINPVSTSILSASARAVLSRIVFAGLVLLFYMMLEFFNKSAPVSS